MKSIGFIYEGPADTASVAGPRSNRPIYHLAFFSKHELALKKFWREARRYGQPQLDLFE